ncbi:MAG TPA: dihydrofolate reductase family protein [Gemmatimonadaceae bacterium]|nr:dihydrofolate reductase family protein [Gemmatimonadaceae bacterium]
MRRIIATAFVSIDGVMQAPGGQTEDQSGGFDLGGWAVKYSDQTSGAAVMRLIGTVAKPNDVLLGRKTYDIWAAHWPQASASDPIGPVITKANKYVMTRGTTTYAWANTHALHSIDELKKVKAGDGPDIVLWGSSTLHPQLWDANLIDRLLLMTFPVLLGKGKRLFGGTAHPSSMKLLASEMNSTGVIIATYEAPEVPRFWNAAM